MKIDGDRNHPSLLLPIDEEEYEKALQEVSNLLLLSPPEGSFEARKLHTMGLNLREYESRHYPLFPPDPIDAIKFRMEQQGLKQRDLEPFIGNKSRVSEILNRKRPLNIQMAQALHNNLSIPATVLLKKTQSQSVSLEWEKFPVREMIKRGWIVGRFSEIKSNYQPILEEFLHPLGIDFAPAILFRKTKSVRAKRDLDDYSLIAWMARVAQLADTMPTSSVYRKGNITQETLRTIANLSLKSDGPVLAQKILSEYGVKLVIEKHLSGTKIDAALIYQFARHPIIGMTLRYDRIDNFWFSLMHELAHLMLHTSDDLAHFIDNFEVRYVEDLRENEADTYARNILIPEETWKKSVAFKIPSPSAAKLLAKSAGVHIAIVAGRIRFELNNYQLLHNLVGQGEVRKLFPRSQWS